MPSSQNTRHGAEDAKRGHDHDDERYPPNGWPRAVLKHTVSRIPRSRFSTPIEPPNRDRIREATAGPSPTSPPAVSDSPIDRRSKNLATSGAGSVGPWLSMISRPESGLVS